VQRSYRLCDKDDKYHSRTCKAVKQKAAEQMETVNAAPVTDQAVVTFWEKTYLPFAEENLRASTFIVQTDLGQHLSTHFGTMALKEYKTHMGSLFLTSLGKNWGGARYSTSGLSPHASSATQSTSVNTKHHQCQRCA